MPQAKAKAAKRKTAQETTGKTKEGAGGALLPKQLAALNAQKISDVTPEQIASIHSNASLLKIPAKARAALSAEQIRAVDVRRLSVAHLTDQQIGWLSQDQVQQLVPAHLRYVQQRQVDWVTVEQMAGIRDDALRHMAEEVRAAFGEHHVQAMDFSRVSLRHLLPEQCAWMTSEQIRSLGYRQFRYLSPDQVAQLSVEQVTSIPTLNVFQRLPKSVREAFTEEHWQAMPSDFDERGDRDGSPAGVMTGGTRVDAADPAKEPQAPQPEPFHDETPYPDDLMAFRDDARNEVDEQDDAPGHDQVALVEPSRDQKPTGATPDPVAPDDERDGPSGDGKATPMALGNDPIQLESLKPEPVAQLGDEPVWSLEDELNPEDAMKLFEEVRERKTAAMSSAAKRRSQGPRPSRARSEVDDKSFFDYLLEWLRSMITPAR